MAPKRKHSGRTMMDDIHESSAIGGLSNSHRRVRSQLEADMVYRPRHIPSESSSIEPSRGVSSSNASDHELSNDTGSSIYVKNVRGPNKCIDTWGTGQKLRLELTTTGEIDGPDRVKFKTQLGVMARNAYALAPIYKSFAHIPRSTLDSIWLEIKDNTNLPEEAKTVVLKDLSSKWKQGKLELKRNFYKPHMNNKKKLVEVPTETLPPDHWSALVRFWALSKTQEEAERNKKNRSGYEFHHQLGRTPMLEVSKELIAKNIEPSRIDLFARSRSRKDRGPLNENTREIIHQMNHVVSQVPEQERTRDMKEKIFTDFMGPDGHGRVSCVGQGITPSQYRHSLTLNETLKRKFREELIQEMRSEMREHIRDEMREQLREEMREEMRTQMKFEMREEMDEMAKMKREMNEQFARQMAQMRDNITQEVAENVVMYLGSGSGVSIAPLLSNANPFSTYEKRQDGGRSMAYVANAERDDNDVYRP